MFICPIKCCEMLLCFGAFSLNITFYYRVNFILRDIYATFCLPYLFRCCIETFVPLASLYVHVQSCYDVHTYQLIRQKQLLTLHTKYQTIEVFRYFLLSVICFLK